jgi:hypothetical protein
MFARIRTATPIRAATKNVAQAVGGWRQSE